jgi:hypothetical protein
MKKAFKGFRTALTGFTKTVSAVNTVQPTTAAELSVKIENYDNMSYYERQKALDALSVERTLKRLTTNCRSKAMRDNKAFDITHQDLVDLWNRQKGLCYYSKQPMTLPSGTHRKPNHNRVSVDRYDNTKGYVKGNLRLCKWIANQAKGSGNSRTLIKFCKDVVSGGRTR